MCHSFIYCWNVGSRPAEAGCLFFFEKDLMSQKLPPMGRFLKKEFDYTLQCGGAHIIVPLHTSRNSLGQKPYKQISPEKLLKASIKGGKNQPQHLVANEAIDEVEKHAHHRHQEMILFFSVSIAVYQDSRKFGGFQYQQVHIRWQKMGGISTIFSPHNLLLPWRKLSPLY